MEFETLPVLFGVALVAGFMDSIAGGSGLLTLPALLLAGLPPVEALGTNKLQGVFGAGSATLAFARARLIHWPTALPYAVVSTLSGAGGALIATSIPKEMLQAFMPILLVLVALYFALSSRMRDVEARARLNPVLFGFTTPLFIGFYDGAFGPGAGSFYMVGFVTLLGYGVTKATAHTKLLNFGSNFGSLAVFAVQGAFVVSIGVVMALGAFIGAQLGSRAAMRFGTRLIRPLLVIVCLAMAVRLLADADNPVHRFIGAYLT
ncbi:MAG: TSUP family transporter [Methylobacteriaceae bacterium]|jgi:uncharacterized membrane protein YfcA|nr:TSUP family transporter [Methylobacteriaceae bacterium]